MFGIYSLKNYHSKNNDVNQLTKNYLSAIVFTVINTCFCRKIQCKRHKLIFTAENRHWFSLFGVLWLPQEKTSLRSVFLLINPKNQRCVLQCEKPLSWCHRSQFTAVRHRTITDSNLSKVRSWSLEPWLDIYIYIFTLNRYIHHST